LNKKLTNGLLALDRWTTGAAMALAVAALALAVAAGFWQVVSRFALAQPATWSEALVRVSLIWMAYLGLAGCFRQGALVSIDLAHRLTTGAVRRLLETMTLAASLLLMGVMFWNGWTMAERVARQNMAGLDISIAYGYAAIPIGAVFCCIGVLAHYFDPARRNEELENAV
jgi:TRAP-type C4-dicarboxylate transport system permease small subunit